MPQATEPRGIGRAILLPLFPTVGGSGIAPLFGLAPGGVYRAAVSPPWLVRSYRTISPLPGVSYSGMPFCKRIWRCIFCGTFLRVTPTGRYPAPCSLEPGLSSPRASAKSDHLYSFTLSKCRVYHTESPGYGRQHVAGQLRGGPE